MTTISHGHNLSAGHWTAHVTYRNSGNYARLSWVHARDVDQALDLAGLGVADLLDLQEAVRDALEQVRSNDARQVERAS